VEQADEDLVEQLICPDFFERLAVFEKELNQVYRLQEQDEVDPGDLLQVRRIMVDLGKPGRNRPASRALRQLGKRAVPPVLISCYLLRNEEARQEIVDFLRSFQGDREVRVWLLGGLSSKHDGAKEICRQALGNNMPVQSLLGILSSKSASLEDKVKAGEYLCQERCKESIPHLVQFLAGARPAGHFERKRVQNLARSAGLLGPSLLEPLYDCMQNYPRGNKRDDNLETLYLAFEGTGLEGRQFLLDKFKTAGHSLEQTRIIRSLGKIARHDAAAADDLLLLLRIYPVGEWRPIAVEELGKVRAREAVPALMGLLDDLDPAVRGRCFTSLALLGCREIIPRAEDALGRPSVDLSAAEALGLLGEERGVDYLFQAACNGAGDRRQRALQALGRVGMNALGYLTRCLGGGNSVNTRTAIEALGKIKGRRAQERAAELLLDVFHWGGSEEVVKTCQSLKLLGISTQPVLRELERLAQEGRQPQERAVARDALEKLSRRSPSGNDGLPHEI